MVAQRRAVKRREFDERGFAKAREVAAYLAISKVWVYDLCHAGVLAYVRHGKRISISWKSVYDYAAERTVHQRSA
jgi:excisionase family DNA binding protein